MRETKILPISFFWIFWVMIVQSSALFLEDEDEKEVLPGDKTNLLWDKKYLKKPSSWTFPVHF